MVAKSKKRISLATGADYWFVRLPDGRIVRSRSTDALRAHLKAGRIPWHSRVRRSREEPWRVFARTAAFADLAAVHAKQMRRKNRPALPDKPKHGVRRSVDELCNALEVSLRKNKLATAALTGLLISITFILSALASGALPAGWNWLAYVGALFVACILFSACNAIVSQLTAFELSRYRPAQFHEINSGLLGSILRLTASFVLIGSVFGVLIFVLRSLPGWISPADFSDVEGWLEILISVVAGGCLFLEVLCWPLLAFALLLGPILVVEDCSIWRGFTAWISILRQHLGRIAAYQMLVFASAAVLSLPLLAPVWLTFGVGRGSFTNGEAIPFFLLLGVALAPVLAYLLVAQVFVYLNLRYEFHYSTREK